MTRVRWWMLTLVLLATTINYLDRILFSVLIPEIRKEMAIGDEAYGWINGSFQIAYTIGFLFMGKFIDRVGTRVGYAASLIWWSIAAILHTVATTAFSLGFWRAMLGLGESGNFPAAIKSVAEWFPKKDRAFATGVFNAGTNVASMIGPPLFVAVTASFGWRACFIATASLGFLWLAAWLLLYRKPEEHKSVAPAELAYIRSDVETVNEPAIGWLQALQHKETWGFAMGKFLSDPVWWFYLYWLPPYFFDVRGFDLKQIGWALPFIYLMADVGSVGGGWLSGYLIRQGWERPKARKAAMLLCAALMPIAATSALVANPIAAILLISLATSAHQGWSANLYTTASDVFPKSATASITGIGGALGGLGGFLFSAVIPGYVVANFGYTPVFLAMGFFHLTAFVFVHKLMGNLEPIRPAAPAVGR